MGAKLTVGVNDLASQCPELVAEWDYEKNVGMSPESTMRCSNKMAWWRCSAGHSWQAMINNRSRLGRGCPYCSGRLPIVGETDLQTVDPELAAQWSPRNGELTPEMVAAASQRKVWWIGECGHEWEASIANRHRLKRGCPYCAGQKALAGYNDLATFSPHLAAEWNYEKNGDLTPEKVTKRSSRKVWWKCAHGHEWQEIILNRVKGHHNCPYCSGHKVLVGETDLATVAPDVAAEWDYEKNGSLTPQSVTAGNDRIVWWRCKLGHSYKADVRRRVVIGCGCPYCSNKRVLPGFNDLATTHPDLASQWCYELNGELTPQSVTYGAPKMVWWECEKGHRWEALLTNRSKGIGCPKCKNERDVSFPEKAIHYYLSKVFDDVEPNSYGPNGCLGRMNMDLWIPSASKGVEYDGYYWHQDIKRDMTKDELCKENGIQLIRVREEGCPQYESDASFIVRKKPFDNVSLDAAVEEVLATFGKEADVDTERDRDDILELMDKKPQYVQKWGQMSLDLSHAERLAQV